VAHPPASNDLPAPDGDAVLAALSRVLASPAFAASRRHRDFLQYVVLKRIDDPEADLKESTIALEVFGRDPASYDPRLDTIVRVQARGLRTRLEEYYAGSGADDPVRISLPKGSYVPVFGTRPDVRAGDARVSATPPSPAAAIEEPAVNSVRRAPHARYARAALLAAGLTALVTAGLMYLSRADGPGAALAHRSPSVAVLPLVNASGDPSLEPFIDGLTDEITDALTRIAGLKVVSRTSAFQYKGKSEDVREIGRALGVSTLVEGTVQKSGDRLKVIAQLNRTDDGTHLWSQVFMVPADGLFELQTTITRSVASALGPALETEVRRQQPRTTSWPAWEAYSRGLFALHRGTPGAYAEAFAYFDEAVRIDPSFAAALARRGASRVSAASETNAADAHVRRLGRQDIERAIEMDPGQSHLLANIAGMTYLYEYDWPAAEALYRRALESSPSEAVPHGAYAGALMLQGRTAEAEAGYARALSLNPLDFLGNLNRATVPLFGGNPRESIDRLRRFADVNPGNPAVLGFLMRAQVVSGDTPGARETMDAVRAADKTPEGGYRTFCEIGLAVLEGRHAEARTLIQSVEGTLGRSFAYNIGVSYALLADAPRATTWLLEAIRRRESFAAYIPVDPALDRIRFSPQFRAVWDAIPGLTAELPYPGPFARK
jgi:TolB-like protein/tetratricopeptide (TPR) repeat protein